MPTVAEHYANHLAPIYAWMAGGVHAAIAQGGADIAPFLAAPGERMLALDLGAGFGMHTIPIARAGYAVTAIDTSVLLLTELQTQAAGLRVRAVEDDLLNFQQYVAKKADLIVCMGDTLTHLSRQSEVDDLLQMVAHSLKPGGKFVATFRDYSRSLSGQARFIPVRSDENRILTCFLEYGPEHVMVHDMVHERSADGWQMRVSAYPKLRISPTHVAQSLQKHGLPVVLESAPRGMVRAVATGA
ncbi:MAG: class I SAM-dependent methyltransferase [Bacteroidota bacterium]